MEGWIVWRVMRGFIYELLFAYGESETPLQPFISPFFNRRTGAV